MRLTANGQPVYKCVSMNHGSIERATSGCMPAPAYSTVITVSPNNTALIQRRGGCGSTWLGIARMTCTPSSSRNSGVWANC